VTGRPAPEVDGPIATLVKAGGRLLVVADFDGTLADYHPDPMGAVPAPGVRSVLRRLASHAADRPERLAVAVLTGRLALDVATRVRVGGLRYLGNHGNELGELERGRPAERLRVALAAGLEAYVPAADRLADAVVASVAASSEGAVVPAWLFVERKGPAVGFHWRAATDRAEAQRRLESAFAEAASAGLTDGFQRIDQRLITEFQPAVAGAKGDAVANLLDELMPAAALVMGDDAPDAAAFSVVTGARASGRLVSALTVAVEHGRPLARELVASADQVVSGTRGAAALLRTLADLLDLERPLAVSGPSSRPERPLRS
jgi:trehalose-phosphatase